jgi:hypothetical protein
MATVTKTRVRYEDDLFAWTQEQAALLRAHAVDAIDWENLAEEIESIGGRDRRELIRDAYASAVKEAIIETGLRADTFPSACPYAPDDVLDEDFLPATDL